jgi:hypothetical protein
MSIESIIKSCRPVLSEKTSKGDYRCFFEDEAKNILYVFGPSHFLRIGYTDKSQSDIEVVEFESGPYIGLGDEILAKKFATGLGVTYDHGIPVVSINYESEYIPKKKKNRKKNK